MGKILNIKKHKKQKKKSVKSFKKPFRIIENGKKLNLSQVNFFFFKYSVLLIIEALYSHRYLILQRVFSFLNFFFLPYGFIKIYESTKLKKKTQQFLNQTKKKNLQFPLDC